MVNALKTQSVEPVMVMILSGQEPSEMLTRALLCGEQKIPNVSYETISDLARKKRRRGLFQKLLPQLKAAGLNFVFCL